MKDSNSTYGTSNSSETSNRHYGKYTFDEFMNRLLIILGSVLVLIIIFIIIGVISLYYDTSDSTNEKFCCDVLRSIKNCCCDK